MQHQLYIYVISICWQTYSITRQLANYYQLLYTVMLHSIQCYFNLLQLTDSSHTRHITSVCLLSSWYSAIQQVYDTLFYHLTRTSYLYNGCLAWYNVLVTSPVHSSMKSQFPKVRQTKYIGADSCDVRTRATVG